ncbi:ADAMTS-like protein 1 [Fukomys damarensis]|uniref:ADAMTS-like protein 1 n=1 Tax=Fukomys damarensis TaxID=885580 RepID=UPI0014556E17|nr:ADAMTS-like protein 1 [Fukomys damarensis]
MVYYSIVHLSCEGRNIRYRTCSNADCPPEAGDFRAQQCSAHNDVKYHGQFYEWLPVSNDPDNPCSLKCQAKGTALVVELAPKVLDGTRCYPASLDMCISGLCQIVGCDHQLGSTAKEDNCGVCNGDGSTCRLVRGQYKSQLSATKLEDTVVAIPYGSRHIRLVLKGPDHLYLETKTLQGTKGENSLSSTGTFLVDNSSVEFQKFPDKEILRMTGPLTADFIIKIRNAGSADSTVQFIFHQPIVHRWRETDFFPCSATCGGGYQLTSAECHDLRSSRVVADQYCHYYPENVKPKPRLQECNLDPCPASDGYKQIMPYDLYHPLPRWEATPWTACSSSCGGGIQSRAVSCEEEDIQGRATSVEEWKCMYTPKMPVVQPCNIFDCPKWLAQEWSPCTVTCGQGLRYRVVLCMDHRGMHTGGCSPKTKPHIKEECIIPTPCYKPKEKVPVEAKLPWFKQAQELEEGAAVSGEPSFVPEAWSACTATCGVGVQVRVVRGQALFDWAFEGFAACSRSCGGGVQEAVVSCLNRETRERADAALCVTSRRPPQSLKPCSLDPCPGRWEAGQWSPCTFTCGVGLQTRDVSCSGWLSTELRERVALADQLCPGPKPNTVQVCNRFDCPPAWDPEPWQPCSRTCGGGVQKREVLCKQRMADGSFLELPDTFCSASKPTSQQDCKQEDCPSEWLLSNWTECSASCGEGTQTRSAVCLKVLRTGVSTVVSSSLCPPLPFAASLRPCTLAKSVRMQIHKSSPALESLPVVEMWHLLFVLLVTLKLELPAPPLGSTDKGEEREVGLKGSAKPPHTGCDPAQWPRGRDQEAVGADLVEADGGLLPLFWNGAGCAGVCCMWPSVPAENREGDCLVLLRTSIGVFGVFVHPALLLLLGLFCLALRRSLLQLTCPPRDSLQALVVSVALVPLYASESCVHRAKPDFASDVFAQTPQQELSTPEIQGRSPEPPSEEQEHVCNDPGTGDIPLSASTVLGVRPRALLHGGCWDIPEEEASRCSRRHSRILLQPDDSLQILAPVEADVGFYTCNATNALGYDSVSIAVTLAGKPLVKASRVTVTNTEEPAVTVDIGSTVRTVQGVNVTINCHVAGVPEAEVTWFRNKSALGPSHHPHEGSLLLTQVSPSDQGLYSCRAANVHGELTESTRLLVLEAPRVPTQLEEIRALLSATGPNLPSVLTSPVGAQLILDPGNSALLGCPIQGHPTPNITWFHGSQPIATVAGLAHHTLAAGQILQVTNLSVGSQGEFICLAQNEAGLLAQKASLVIQDYGWALDRPAPCSASCGNRGVQQPRLRCLQNTTEVDPERCSGRVRPTVQPVACNRRDCPSRWMVTSWSACTRSCGGGIQTRRVTCQKLKASGFSATVSNDLCTQHAKRPVDTQACNQQLCVEWAFSSWGQCSGPCVGPHLAMQHRQVFCQTRDGIALPSEQCSALPRPVSSQSCWSETCSVHWRVSLWTLCTATCGNYGFQSRRVECVLTHTNKAVSDHLCSWGARPANWQRCNITPCENRECRDTTRYCEKVRQLQLCQLSQFQLRCCGTCGQV